MRRRLLLASLAAALLSFPLACGAGPRSPRRVPTAGWPFSSRNSRTAATAGAFASWAWADFDHGHLLFAENEERPFAILYHTQELGAVPGADPAARNWIQMIGSRRVGDARAYLRASYPQEAYWEWFESRELPRYRSKGTIVWEMLDPGLMGARVASARQWEFSRTPCRSAGSLDIRVPGRGSVCLNSSL